ncbi:hypothetical protein KY290_010838 [Solanum tuberosum]|uniref:Transmembrane protein n=1 Tax=Solanum tuberosum TaxID=4113 RepID=A0ABQ7W057_SOLTU|nr:hypothetical protein KY290_010838 [Solanum tuberosum]
MEVATAVAILVGSKSGSSLILGFLWLLNWWLLAGQEEEREVVGWSRRRKRGCLVKVLDGELVVFLPEFTGVESELIVSDWWSFGSGSVWSWLENMEQ